jgi:hypothetical protein
LNLVLILGLGLLDVKAQLLNVKEKNNSLTSFQLNNLRKLTFNTGKLNVQEKDNSSNLYELKGLRFLDFSSITTGTESYLIDESNFYTLSPNPVIDVLTIHFKNKPQNCIVHFLSIEGKVLYTSQPINEQVISIDISSLPKGIYFCKCINGLQNNTVKIIKL